MIEWIAAQPPGRIALRHEGAAISYGVLAARIEAAAAMLSAEGVGRGDRVAFLGENHPSQIVLVLACARLGAMQVPLNWRLVAAEHRWILEDCGARLLFATRAMRVAAEAAAPPGCAVRDAEADWPAGTAPARGSHADPVLLVYTSGTTGRPKGAVLTQAALAANAANSRAVFDLTGADRVLTCLPLFHVGGLNIQTLPALAAGAEVTLLPRFEPDAWFAALAAQRPTLSLLVPAVMQALVAHPAWPGADLASLRAIGAGSSELPLPLIEAFHARGVPVQQVYGATETGPIALAQTRAEALAAPGSIGHPPPACEARIVDDEIELRGPMLASRYWNAPEATAEAFRDGWFRSGDLGRVDAQGRFWFIDRRSNRIISGGENIAPAEVERVLREAPGVREGAVLGAPDPRWGQVPVAIVVPGAGFDAATVLAHFDGRLARFKHPRRIVTVAALPRTALGKLALGELRKLLDADA